MKKIVPLREQVVRACLESKITRSSYNVVGVYLMSGCFCHQHMNDNLDKCDKCILRFECYTTFRVRLT